MAIEREFICTACPKGCLLRVVLEGKDVVKMEGYTCRKGLDYGRQEISDPRRMLATTVRVENGFHPLLPVYTQKPISKDKIEAVLAALRELRLKAPVKAQSVVLADVAGTGVDVLASRDMPTAGE
jgi:CxxC motif-containing protein